MCQWRVKAVLASVLVSSLTAQQHPAPAVVPLQASAPEALLFLLAGSLIQLPRPGAAHPAAAPVACC